MKLSDSCEMYISALEETKHSKPGYKAEKLKKKLEKSDTYRQTLSFCSLNSGGKFKLYRVYNSDVSTDHAVTLAYELGSADIVRDDALCLRNMIAEAFYNSKTCHSSQPMTSFGRLMSTELKTFLN